MSRLSAVPSSRWVLSLGNQCKSHCPRLVDVALARRLPSLKQSNRKVAIGSGTYDISFLNKGGAEPTLGRLLLSGGNVLKCVSANAIPEPPAITLFGIGFAGLFASRRRKMN